jgi:hypothetical protein
VYRTDDFVTLFCCVSRDYALAIDFSGDIIGDMSKS